MPDRGPTTPLRLSVATALDLLAGCVAADEIGDAARLALRHHPASSQSPTCLVGLFRARLAQEQECASCPGWQFLSSLSDLARMATEREFLEVAAENYVARTRYLFAVFMKFAKSIASIRPPGGVYLFLRDALPLWPSLLGLVPADLVHFLIYSRCHHDAGLPPRAVAKLRTGAFRLAGSLNLAQALLVDIGIWGSLVLQLVKDGCWKPDASVLFLGTRNPNIEGWANARLVPHLLDGKPGDPLDVVRLVDTVESLLKPFTFCPGSIAADTEVELADPLSLACSAALLWALQWYASADWSSDRVGGLEWFDHFRAGFEDPEAWCVREPAPKSQDGERFLEGWHCGPLAPRNTYCGFSL